LWTRQSSNSEPATQKDTENSTENMLQDVGISLVLPCLQAFAAWTDGLNPKLPASANRASTITLGMSS
jgi:hypothetical protein